MKTGDARDTLPRGGGSRGGARGGAAATTVEVEEGGGAAVTDPPVKLKERETSIGPCIKGRGRNRAGENKKRGQ